MSKCKFGSRFMSSILAFLLSVTYALTVYDIMPVVHAADSGDWHEQMEIFNSAVPTLFYEDGLDLSPASVSETVYKKGISDISTYFYKNLYSYCYITRSKIDSNLYSQSTNTGGTQWVDRTCVTPVSNWVRNYDKDKYPDGSLFVDVYQTSISPYGITSNHFDYSNGKLVVVPGGIYTIDRSSASYTYPRSNCGAQTGAYPVGDGRYIHPGPSTRWADGRIYVTVYYDVYHYYPVLKTTDIHLDESFYLPRLDSYVNLVANDEDLAVFRDEASLLLNHGIDEIYAHSGTDYLNVLIDIYNKGVKDAFDMVKAHPDKFVDMKSTKWNPGAQLEARGYHEGSPAWTGQPWGGFYFKTNFNVPLSYIVGTNEASKMSQYSLCITIDDVGGEESTGKSCSWSYNPNTGYLALNWGPHGGKCGVSLYTFTASAKTNVGEIVYEHVKEYQVRRYVRYEKEDGSYTDYDLISRGWYHKGDVVPKWSCNANTIYRYTEDPSFICTGKEDRYITVLRNAFPIKCVDILENPDGTETRYTLDEIKRYIYGSTAKGSDWGTFSPYDLYTFYSDTSKVVEVEPVNPNEYVVDVDTTRVIANPFPDKLEYNYSGTDKTYTVPVNGTYIVTLSGAQGGNYNDTEGGLGAELKLRMSLKKGDVLTVSIGGQGQAYNGGGRGSLSNGGGATSLKLNGHLVAVAGGGGGAYISELGEPNSNNMYTAHAGGDAETFEEFDSSSSVQSGGTYTQTTGGLNPAVDLSYTNTVSLGLGAGGGGGVTGGQPGIGVSHVHKGQPVQTWRQFWYNMIKNNTGLWTMRCCNGWHHGNATLTWHRNGDSISSQPFANAVMNTIYYVGRTEWIDDTAYDNVCCDDNGVPYQRAHMTLEQSLKGYNYTSYQTECYSVPVHGFEVYAASLGPNNTGIWGTGQWRYVNSNTITCASCGRALTTILNLNSTNNVCLADLVHNGSEAPYCHNTYHISTARSSSQWAFSCPKSINYIEEYTPSEGGTSGVCEDISGGISRHDFSAAAHTGDGSFVMEIETVDLEECSAIKISPNGGTYKGLSGSIIYTDEANAKMPIEKPVREGYVFCGWSMKGALKGNLTDTMYTFGAPGSVDCIVATWMPDTVYRVFKSMYHVLFDPNGAEIESDEELMPQMDCCFGKDYAVPVCTYSHYGYIFDGWCLDPSGSGTIYRDGASFRDLATEAGSYVPLYAQWRPDPNITASLYVDPNGGLYHDKEEVQMFRWNPANPTATDSFNYTGSYQIYTCPDDGWYFIEAMGAQGGSDACAGGRGGYVKSYVHLVKGQRLYVSVGQAGWCSGGAADLPNNPTYGGGGRTACNWDTYPICSGVGGGATMVATSLQGNGDIRYYSGNRNDILVVAGGGGGGSDTRAGAGGEVLYDSTGIINGASASLLNGQFGLGSNHRNANDRAEDGGGGGGGYVGGLEGWDGVSGSHGSGGGASFVNTSKGCYDAVLIPSYRSGHGYVRITVFPDDAAHALTPDPVRPGWSFVGWELNNDKSQGEVYLYHNTRAPLWWVDYKHGTAYVQSIWKRTMTLTLDKDTVRNFDSGSESTREESSWTQTITDNTAKHFIWDANTVTSESKKFTDDMQRVKGGYLVTYARNDSNGVMVIENTGKTSETTTVNNNMLTWGSDDITIVSGTNAAYTYTYPKFRGWSTEKFVPGEYIGRYPGVVVGGSESFVCLFTQNANRDLAKQYLYNIEGNKYPTNGNSGSIYSLRYNPAGYELDSRLDKFNTKKETYGYNNITIYPTWYKSTIKLPNAKRNSDKTGNGESPDLFIGWFTKPQLDTDTEDGGEFVGRAGDIVVVDRDIILYPWFNKAPTITRSEIGNNPKASTFWEGEPVSYQQLLTLINVTDKDNYVPTDKMNSKIEWNGIDAWNDGISNWNEGKEAWVDNPNANAFSPGTDTVHDENSNWNNDVALRQDWETFNRSFYGGSSAWKKLYSLNVEVYLHDYVYNSADFASLTDAEKDDIINTALARLENSDNSYDNDRHDDNVDFQPFITGISYYCDGVDSKGNPTASSPSTTNIGSDEKYLNGHVDALYSNDYDATNHRYDGYKIAYDDMYDIESQGLQTELPFVGKIVIHYAIVDNSTFDLYNDKYIVTANGYTIDSHIVVQYDFETEIKFDERPKFEIRPVVLYSNDDSWNADNIVDKVLELQKLTDVEDDQSNVPWWYEENTKPALKETKEVLGINSIEFNVGYEREHRDICEEIRRITDLVELFKLKDSTDVTKREAFEHITCFNVVVDAHDQWNRYVSDGTCGQSQRERSVKVIMFDNYDDYDLLLANTVVSERLRYIDRYWSFTKNTLPELSYWGDNRTVGLESLRDVFDRYDAKCNGISPDLIFSSSGTLSDDTGTTINITINDYSQ